MKKRFIAEGHLIDSGILSSILNLVIEEGSDYEIINFNVGKTHEVSSTLEIDIISDTSEKLDSITKKLIRTGCYEKTAGDAIIEKAPKDKTVPEDFYSTTNHRTEIFLKGKWIKVSKQRMDGVIVLNNQKAECKKLRDVKKGDKILCSPDPVRVFPPERERNSENFGFMSNDVSSERSVGIAVEKIAKSLKRIKENNGKVVAVAGPVLIHTGGANAFASLIREGYIQGLLSGNALAVHDLESIFLGTSLGIDIKTGKPTNEGHKNHMRAINKIYKYGSIKEAVDQKALNSGIMYEIVKKNIPYCLAGSIRDDGPLPETETDMIRAQAEYAEIIKGADMVLMLSSMLHSIGTGNMLPSWVKTICVDINPAVVTKLSDRGSSQTLGIVSDIGLFLRALADNLVGSY